jgi:small-conductance mechanosensitive channel/CRP-like cAMP-binding protein
MLNWVARGRFRSAVVFLALWALFAWIHQPVWEGVALALLELAGLQVVAGLVFEFAVERAYVPRFAVEMGVVGGYAVILFNLLYRLGVNVTGIFATSAVATAVIGLSLQDMLSNIAGGIALELEGGINVGDFIKCAEASGWVRHVRLRHTAIDTPDGDRIILPNSFLTRSSVTVLPKSRRHFIPFSMPYARNPQDLMDTVAAALRGSEISGVATEPRPRCIVQEMAPGHIRYAAVVWMLEPGHETYVISAVLNRIYFSLQRAGIPATEITHLLEMKQATDGSAANANPVDVLKNTPIFRLLDEPGLFELGAQLHHLSFAPGERIIRQSEEGESMYFVTAGEVSITFAGADKLEREVAVMGPGDFFGEASLLTGERRNASAVAMSRVDCYRLEKEGLQKVLNRHQELAEDMSVVMALRQMELAVVRDRLDRETALSRQAEDQKQLLARIRRFFGLVSSSARA